MASTDTRPIIEELRARITAGDDWYRCLMHAAQQWPVGEEVLDGERFLYLIEGEALDLLRLCERICLEVADLVPEEPMLALLASDRPPRSSEREGLRDLIGPERYKAYLTFIYGVIVEELVVQAVLEDLRRRRRTSGLTRYDATLDDAFTHVYGSTRAELFDTFRRERGLRPRRSVTLTQMKEFTYWLFKLRLKSMDKSRVASDTKRALTLLHRYMSCAGRRAA